MTLLAFAAAWYLALLALLAKTAWQVYGRRKIERVSMDEAYDGRREAERARHLARVREEELAEMRRHTGPHAHA